MGVLGGIAAGISAGVTAHSERELEKEELKLKQRKEDRAISTEERAAEKFEIAKNKDAAEDERKYQEKLGGEQVSNWIEFSTEIPQAENPYQRKGQDAALESFRKQTLYEQGQHDRTEEEQRKLNDASFFEELNTTGGRRTARTTSELKVLHNKTKQDKLDYELYQAKTADAKKLKDETADNNFIAAFYNWKKNGTGIPVTPKTKSQVALAPTIISGINKGDELEDIRSSLDDGGPKTGAGVRAKLDQMELEEKGGVEGKVSPEVADFASLSGYSNLSPDSQRALFAITGESIVEAGWYGPILEAQGVVDKLQEQRRGIIADVNSSGYYNMKEVYEIFDKMKEVEEFLSGAGTGGNVDRTPEHVSKIMNDIVAIAKYGNMLEFSNAGILHPDRDIIGITANPEDNTKFGFEVEMEDGSLSLVTKGRIDGAKGGEPVWVDREEALALVTSVRANTEAKLETITKLNYKIEGQNDIIEDFTATAKENKSRAEKPTPQWEKKELDLMLVGSLGQAPDDDGAGDLFYTNIWKPVIDATERGIFGIIGDGIGLSDPENIHSDKTRVKLKDRVANLVTERYKEGYTQIEIISEFKKVWPQYIEDAQIGNFGEDIEPNSPFSKIFRGDEAAASDEEVAKFVKDVSPYVEKGDAESEANEYLSYLNVGLNIPIEILTKPAQKIAKEKLKIIDDMRAGKTQ